MFGPKLSRTKWWHGELKRLRWLSSAIAPDNQRLTYTLRWVDVEEQTGNTDSLLLFRFVVSLVAWIWTVAYLQELLEESQTFVHRRRQA